MTMNTYPEAQALICKSPRLALARALDIDDVPYIFTVSGNFSVSGAAAPLFGLIPNKQIQRDLVIYEVDVDIQTPNFVAGDEFKPEADLAYDYTSGIQTRINIDGYNKRSTPYFPLKAVFKLAKKPWVFLEEQQLTMDFSVTTPLPTAGSTVTVTFICWTPATDTVFRMSAPEAFDELDKLGYCTTYGRRVFGCS